MATRLCNNTCKCSYVFKFQSEKEMKRCLVELIYSDSTTLLLDSRVQNAKNRLHSVAKYDIVIL